MHTSHSEQGKDDWDWDWVQVYFVFNHYSHKRNQGTWTPVKAVTFQISITNSIAYCCILCGPY
jgi:hypothetical protein